jgi:hypothetical protein
LQRSKDSRRSRNTQRLDAALRNVSIFKSFQASGLTIVAIDCYKMIMADVGVADKQAASSSDSEVQRPELILRGPQTEAVMALPKIVVRGKKVILLSGFKNDGKGTGEKREGVVVDAKEKLVLAAKRNPDAVAFGYIAGDWIASA